jgi:hypothetical protein
MIAPTVISDFDKLVKKMIFNSEGDPIRQPSIIRGNDHTVTYGYGFTFIRKGGGKWSLYGDLDADLLKIGITLTQTEKTDLNNIVNALNQGLIKGNYQKYVHGVRLAN